jgi:hypothetical protein
MLLKVPIYFTLEKQGKAKITDVPLLQEKLQRELETYLSEVSFKLSGSWWDDTRIKARQVSTDEALEYLRTKK